MLLDDSEIDNFVHRKFIEERGLAVGEDIIVMGTADKALKYLRDEKTGEKKIPDLILLDINLPAISGYGFLKEFRNLPEPVIKKCKIVVLSSSDKEEDITLMGMDTLVKKYFIKPLSDEAMDQLKHLLE